MLGANKSDVHVVSQLSSLKSELSQDYLALEFYFIYLIFWLFVFSIYSLEGVNRIIVPFIACGDLSGYDADQTYPLATSSGEKEYQSLSPTQEPINPPYKTACLLKKTNCLASSENMGQEASTTVEKSDTDVLS